jgi:hypothetical protein
VAPQFGSFIGHAEPDLHDPGREENDPCNPEMLECSWNQAAGIQPERRQGFAGQGRRDVDSHQQSYHSHAADNERDATDVLHIAAAENLAARHVVERAVK